MSAPTSISISSGSTSGCRRVVAATRRSARWVKVRTTIVVTRGVGSVAVPPRARVR
ncbi:Uncharacterised protein [Mycobacteroides abscessus]|nr:Uncharacterised protein [Mycobacteroides abscessus]